MPPMFIPPILLLVVAAAAAVVPVPDGDMLILTDDILMEDMSIISFLPFGFGSKSSLGLDLEETELHKV
jgi:uncharacterized protein (DUF697 family)